MKIIKLIKQPNNHYFAVFDEIPALTYEKIGSNYVGSAIDVNGNIILSDFLEYDNSPYTHAFAGHEISLRMKDGSITKIKNHWYDCGSYKEHGNFIEIGASTVSKLQECYVYSSYNIGSEAFENMVADYLKRDVLYEYYEVEKWCNLQYEWKPLVIDGKEHPFVINRKGHVYTKDFSEREFPLKQKFKAIGNKCFKLKLFELKYHNGDRLVKIRKRYDDVIQQNWEVEE